MASLENCSNKNKPFLYVPVPSRINSNVFMAIQAWQDHGINENWDEQWISKQPHLPLSSPNHIIRPPNPLYRSSKQAQPCTSNLSNNLAIRRVRSYSMSETPSATFNTIKYTVHDRTLQHGIKIPIICNTYTTLREYAS